MYSDASHPIDSSSKARISWTIARLGGDFFYCECEIPERGQESHLNFETMMKKEDQRVNVRRSKVKPKPQAFSGSESCGESTSLIASKEGTSKTRASRWIVLAR